MNYVFAAKFDSDPDGGFVVSFPDVPEALTHGKDLTEASRNAAEALGLALRGYLVVGRPVPRAAASGRSLVEIPIGAADALKLAVVEAFATSGMTKAELARRLGKAETEAYRILDPDHPTKLAALDHALSVLGKQIVVTVRDAA